MSAASLPREFGDTVEEHGDGNASTVREADRPNTLSNDDESDEEEDEEPKLKYAKLTSSLAPVYRNGDSTSTFWVGGDKIVMGTHNGNIHALSMPEMRILRTYHAHSASVTAVSVSPTPPPPSIVRTSAQGGYGVLETQERKGQGPRPQPQPQTPKSPKSPGMQQQTYVANTPSNQVYIATSSLDGHVCISSLVDPKDVQLRNFKRPVSTVALSPQYRTDKTYLSGGLAGQLVLTVGGAVGRTTEANTTSAAAAATGWLGSIGLARDVGQDTVLHQGEGKVGEIQWSLSQKWVCWVNEEGIKIMRSHLKLAEQTEDAWRRIAHAGKPNRKGWVDMAGVWRPRVEWVDEKHLESDETIQTGITPATNGVNGDTATISTSVTKQRRVEKLVVGWGDTAWIMHVQEGTSADKGQKRVGSADIIHKLQFRDCIVSGISLYTSSMLAILAYRTRDDDDRPINAAQEDDTPRKGRSRRQIALAPQLRLIEMGSGEEIDLDELSMSRFESLAPQDYHFGTVFIPPPKLTKAEREQKSNLEAMWELSGGAYATKLFSSSASVLSRSSSGFDELERASSSTPSRPSGGRSAQNTQTPSEPKRKVRTDSHPHAVEPGLKLFIQSPYDCILALKRDLSDHLDWMLEHQKYSEAWHLLDQHPEAIPPSMNDRQSLDFSMTSSSPPATSQRDNTLADFFADNEDSLRGTSSDSKTQGAAQMEKRRIGELWLQQLIDASKWQEAGQVAGKILGRSSRWEHWVLVFAQADKFDEITPFIPGSDAVLPSLVYEVVLGHYIASDRVRLKDLLETWDPELFDVRSVISAIETQFESGTVSEDTVEDGQKGRDWHVLTDALAKLYLSSGRPADALRCYIRTHNADAALALVKDESLFGAIAEDIPGFLTLKISKDLMDDGTLQELEEAANESIQLLVEEAFRGTVAPSMVIQQLEPKGPEYLPFLFFYLRALWQGASASKSKMPRRKWDRRIDEGHALVEDHADLAVSLFADYDRPLFMEFLRASELYSYDKAAAICEQRHYVPELVYVLSKTGQLKQALFLIIGELGDVKQAIEFCKENPDLWNVMLDYSMHKPSFIRGLLEEVGTAINPVELVRRIPDGLEIEGLREAVAKMIREHEIQWSISKGVAKVLSGEVSLGMDTLRAGQKKGVKFEVVHENTMDVELAVRDPPTKVAGGEGETIKIGTRRSQKEQVKQVKPGHCVGCGEPFHEDEKETLIGFACGHVYHISCLLRCNQGTADDRTIDRLMGQLGTDDDYDEYSGRSVGGKVAHAHIIKNVLQGGCQHCIVPDGA